MEDKMKKLIENLNGCYINNGNARFIDHEEAEKLLENFKKKIELKTLQEVQFLFKIQSDLSCATNGYRRLCEQIKQSIK
jgi:hypothetical protein